MSGSAGDDEAQLRRLGYRQELERALGAFSNLALSLSIICVLAGGITSFHVGLASAGGAAIGIGWPLACLYSLAVALCMAQLASAFPTAGGLYHWAALLGGRGWGWITAWFNLAGLVTVLAAINVGAYETVMAALGIDVGPWKVAAQTAFVLTLACVQAAINHRGIRLTARLTDFSGWWILAVSVVLTAVLLFAARSPDVSRLWTFTDLSGLPEAKPVWPTGTPLAMLFFLGMLLPAYTITGFDASAHAAEETVDAAHRVPRGIVRSVVLSGLFGWALLSAAVVAAPDLRAAANEGGGAFAWILRSAVPPWAAAALMAAVIVAQLLCGLATVTSASRMLFAFARDGGVPFSASLRHVGANKVPAAAVWCVALVSVAFTVLTPVYETITAVCALFLYISYVLPTLLGLATYGRWMPGPWHIGAWYRPLAVVSVLGCVGLFGIAVQPPNGMALWVALGFTAALLGLWFGGARGSFPGPPSAH